MSGTDEKHRQVHDWLESIFVDGDQPQYEITKRPLEILHSLMTRCKQRDQDMKLVIQDLNQKTLEYKAEAARLGAILQQMGLSPSSLSQSGDVSLRTLTSTALQLDIRNTSDTSYLLGMQKLSQELMSAADARKVEQKAYSQMVSKTKTAVNKTEALRRALQSLNEQTTCQVPEMENKSKQAGFLQSKSKEYKQHIQQYKTQLGRSGLQPHYGHEELCRKYEELQNLEDKLIPLRSKLHSYKDLPPDLSLAKVKIEESRQQLVALEKELSKHIDMSHM